jgi:hypothetical protein
MRTLATYILAGLLASVAAAQVTQDIDCAHDQSGPSPLGCTQSSYNRFDDKTTVSLDWMLLSQSKDALIFFSVSASSNGNKLWVPDTFIIYISSISNSSFDFTPDCKLTILADDHRQHYELFPPVRKTLEGKMSEVFGARSEYADLRQIATAKTVDIRLCYTEFNLTPAQLGRLRDFLKRFGESGK